MAFLFVMALFTLLAVYIIKKRKPTAKRPPSPWKLPLIGNIHQMLSTTPHRALRDLSLKHGAIMQLKLGQVDNIVISSPEFAREILKIHDLNFASRPEILAYTVLLGNKDVVFTPYGSYWRHLRKICVLELLSARRVKSFHSIREEENSFLLSSIMSASAGKPVLVNLSEKLLLLANTTTARAVFGAKCKHATRYISVMKKAIDLGSGFSLVDLYPSLGFLSGLLGTNAKLARIHSQFNNIMDEIIDEHRRSNNSSIQDGAPEDLVSVLLRIHDAGDLEFSLANMKAVIFDMFTAGTDTSATILTWAMTELMRHPAVMKKVQLEVREACKGKRVIEDGDLEEMQYMKLVIKETLRLHTPVPVLMRRATGEETYNGSIGGFEIPRESRILINVWAIARDPKYWQQPDSFVPERFEGISMEFKGENFQYLPFGGGRRMCPGVAFGLANVELALAHLLFYFDWELPDKKELDMTEQLGATLNKIIDLCLIATPRFPLP